MRILDKLLEKVHKWLTEPTFVCHGCGQPFPDTDQHFIADGHRFCTFTCIPTMLRRDRRVVVRTS